MNQAPDEPQVEALIEALQNGLPRDLTDQEVAALLGWIASSSRNPGAQLLGTALGPSGDNEAVTGHAFSLLDEAIFAGDSLLTAPAGVGSEREHDARRRRYRLLLSAFHPDRFPARADWLTSRSQVITRAYARFKTGQTDEMPTEEAPTPPVKSRPPEYRGITPNWRLAERLRSRWGQDRFLAHKIIGVLALVLLLPVVSILLDQQIRQEDPSERSSGPRINLHTLDLRVEQWPLASLSAPWLESDSSGRTVEEAETGDRSESRWASVQAAAAIGIPDWLDRARVGVPGSSPNSPGIQMLAWMGETWNQIDAFASASDVQRSLPQTSRQARIIEPVAESRNTRNPATTQPSSRPEQTTTPPPPRQSDQTTNRPTDQPTNRPNDQSPFPDGSINLGPLANHQVGNLLSDYRNSIEAGDLEGVLEVLAREPRDNNRIGRDWFEQHYRELFDISSQRSLSLQVLNATRQGNGWRVAAQYQLDLRHADSGQDDRMERDVEFVILPDPFRLKIVAVEY